MKVHLLVNELHISMVICYPDDGSWSMCRNVLSHNVTTHNELLSLTALTLTSMYFHHNRLQLLHPVTHVGKFTFYSI